MLRQSFPWRSAQKGRKPSSVKAPRPVIAIPSKAKPIQQKPLSTAKATPSPFPLLHAQPATPSDHPTPAPYHRNRSPAESRDINASKPVDDSWRVAPLVQKARSKSVKQRSIWESYLVLDSRTRLLFSLGLGVVGLVGLYLGDLVQDEQGGEDTVGVETAVKEAAEPSVEN